MGWMNQIAWPGMVGAFEILVLACAFCLVIFQPEIRRALAELGRQPLFAAPRESRDFDEERLRRFLSAVLGREPASASRWTRARRQLDLSPGGIAKSEALAGGEGAARGG